MELSRFNGLVFMPMSTERAAHVIGMKSPLKARNAMSAGLTPA